MEMGNATGTIKLCTLGCVDTTQSISLVQRDVEEFYNQEHDSATGRFGDTGPAGSNRKKGGGGGGAKEQKPLKLSANDPARIAKIAAGVAAVAVGAGLVYYAGRRTIVQRAEGKGAKVLGEDVKDYASKVGGEHAAAVERYTGLSYEMNQSLRGTKATFTPYDLRDAHMIDDVIDHAPGLDKNTAVYRGMPLRGDLLDDLGSGKAIGKEIGDDAFMSTTLDPWVAKGYANGAVASNPGAAVVKINAPVGTKGIYMGNQDNNSEFLMGRGGKLQITKAVKNADGVWDIEADLVSQSPKKLAAVTGRPIPTFTPDTRRAIPVGYRNAAIGTGAITALGGMTYAGDTIASEPREEASVRRARRLHAAKVAGAIGATALGAGLLYKGLNTQTIGATSAEAAGFRRGVLTYTARLTGSYKAAIGRYVKPQNAAEVNGVLRATEKATVGQKARVFDQVRIMDRAMDRAPALEKEAVVFRGMKLDAANPITKDLKAGKLVGKTITDKGFMSTSLEEALPQRHLGSGDSVMLRINVPKGNKGLYIQHHKRQSEFLLPRGSKIRLTSVTDLGNGRYQANADLVGFDADDIGHGITAPPPIKLLKGVSAIGALKPGLIGVGTVTTTAGLRYSGKEIDEVTGTSSERVVRTPEGAARYGVPIGSPIPTAKG